MTKPRSVWRDPRAVNLTDWQPPVTYEVGYYLRTALGVQVGVILSNRERQRYEYHLEKLLWKAERGQRDPVFG